MKLLEQVRQALRVKHFSLRTERCYLRWAGTCNAIMSLREPCNEAWRRRSRDWN